MIDYRNLKAAISNLALQLENLENSATRAELTALDREALGESVIQRFEVAYELSWKFLKRYLSEELGMTDLPSSPKPILRLGDANGLLDGKVESWLKFADARVATSHDYDRRKADQTLLIVPEFVLEAKNLYSMISGEKWG